MPSQPLSYYEQRHNKDASLEEESKRRKMIRWIKKSFGIPEEQSRRESRRHQQHLQHHQPYRQQPQPQPQQPSSARVKGQTRVDQSYESVKSATHSSSFNTSDSMDEPPGSWYSPSLRQHAPSSASMSPGDNPHVLIIGAGLGGLCLAQGLKKHGIPFTVFERDPSPNYRSQGYRVRIDTTGYEALKANLSATNVQVLLRATGHFLPAVDYMDAASGSHLRGGKRQAFEQQQPNNKSSRLPHHHIFSPDRAMLRSLLLTDLDEADVQYGMAFKRYDVLPNGRVQVTFENGRAVEGSLLVGADGTTSRVRRQYIPGHVSLLDTDTGAIYGKTPRTPELEALFSANSSTIVLSEWPPMSLVVEPRGRTTVDIEGLDLDSEMADYIGWVLISRARHFHRDAAMTTRELFTLPPERVAQLSVAMTRDWDPRVRALLERQVPDWCVLLRICSMAPDMKPWTPSPVTLLGDAVHTMAPAGLGCNTALYDAQVLVRAFLQRGVTVDAVAAYERELRAAGAEGVGLSIDACAQMYGMPRAAEMSTIG